MNPKPCADYECHNRRACAVGQGQGDSEEIFRGGHKRTLASLKIDLPSRPGCNPLTLEKVSSRAVRLALCLPKRCFPIRGMVGRQRESYCHPSFHCFQTKLRKTKKSQEKPRKTKNGNRKSLHTSLLEKYHKSLSLILRPFPFEGSL